jgi:hypothetical protein
LTFEQKVNILTLWPVKQALEADMGIVVQEVVSVGALVSFFAAIALWADGIAHILAVF